MWRFMKKVNKVTVGLLSGAAVAFAVAYAALTVVGYKPVAVYSGSMEPKIPVGGLVLDRAIPAKEVRVGDVITSPTRTSRAAIARSTARPPTGIEGCIEPE